ncbi:MAG: hypothetical protein WB383_09075 [Acidimicrobiales bacterium]
MTTEPPDRQLVPGDGRAPASPNANDNFANDAPPRRRTISWRSPSTWLPNAPARTAGPAASTDRPAAGILDEREHRFSVAASVLALGLVAAAYIVNRHSTVTKVRGDALELFVAGLILVAIMFGGIFFRRASMVGIASFMMGFELFSGGDLFGVIFLVFGGWLLLRMVRRQRAEIAAGGRPSRASKSTPARTAGPPKPSKRYTPPRRSRASARRR